MYTEEVHRSYYIGEKTMAVSAPGDGRKNKTKSFELTGSSPTFNDNRVVLVRIQNLNTYVPDIAIGAKTRARDPNGRHGEFVEKFRERVSPP